ncbi:hypothetical protein GRS96_12385 [Rathayibacter sp. VKM Ac-2803]|uniref:Gp19/Gp15/Gp42 family protein n=1 Tax=Rathayibacter sp. VKM Ac-2803 TaxID=2609256 RepID=UPI00135C89EC|nr:Gp19/Gp15/Gp42 family protein [Rathayibacter sp. VKM Ac-2803]MWV50067.1 hypothetical protein [Rathayibacter sp. VKM Ac-2803]
MDNPADIEDVKDRIERPLLPEEIRAATKLVEDAWGILHDEIPALEHRLAMTGDAPARLKPDSIKRTIGHMVARVVRNFEGLRSWGEDTYQETIDAVLSSGQLYLTDVERNRLAPRVEVPASGVYSLPLTGA